MVQPRRGFVAPNATVEAAIRRVRAELSVPDAFPAEVDAEAASAASRGPRAPWDGTVASASASVADTWPDRTDLPFLTIDPPGSRDLDQALCLASTARGFRFHYAIADVAAFVSPGSAMDSEARRRGVTLYVPDRRAPLHPDPLGEGAASLLPGVARPAVCWEFDLDRDAVVRSARVARATIRSRAALSYEDAQAAIDGRGGPAEPSRDMLAVLAEIGPARLALEAERGGVSLDLPEQSVEPVDGGYELVFRTTLPVERWNAQLSLLCGMEAAKLMGEAGAGIVRTLPPPAGEVVARLRRSAGALGLSWPPDVSYAAWVRNLDRADPRAMAMANLAARALRGASYELVAGGEPVARHSAIAAPYAHVTAPLRRLVDRFGSEVALAASAGRAVPEWVTASLGDLPGLMGQAAQRSARLERAVVDVVEALVLGPHVGESFDAVVVEANNHTSQLQLVEPAVVTTVPGTLPLGEALTVRLVGADPVAGTVQFEPV